MISYKNSYKIDLMESRNVCSIDYTLQEGVFDLPVKFIETMIFNRSSSTMWSSSSSKKDK